MPDLELPAWSEPFTEQARPNLLRAVALRQVDREWAWGGATGAGVKVAIIDSGVEGSHPRVGGRLVESVAVEIRDEEAHVVPDDPVDLFGHGTACAGIIRSLAPECELYSVKVLGPLLQGRGPVFVAGVRWAIEQGMHVCNLSLGTTKRDYYAILHELTDLAYFRNIVLVSAANNLPVPSFPSVYSSVISVASHDIKDDDLFYYNPSPPVEFGALGIDVRVPWRRGGWITVTGNSFAAPRITGIVAAILGSHPGLTCFQVKGILRALAANVVREEAR